jgi:cyclic 2,3-diphosphoglycerate synthetase
VARAGALSRALVLIDGEHYPPVVRAAVAGLGVDVAAALFLGGAEKLRSAPAAADYGVPRLLEGALAAAIAESGATVVVDLSDEPVLSQRSRLALVAEALASGAEYRVGGARFAPPEEAGYPLPSIAVVGTGKRVGKTAVAAHLARLARERLAPAEVVVVAMGRGGPPEPELIEPGAVDAAELLRRSRAGAHAASDFLEDALLAGVPAVGARRCGGGLAGEVTSANVAEAARLAAARRPALTVFDGSGAAFPPVRCTRTLLVVPATVDREELFGYLGPYRLRRADAVLVIGDAPDLRARIDRPVMCCELEPWPTVPVAGRQVAVFATSSRPAMAEALRAQGARSVSLSGALGDRPRLREALAAVDADLFLTELKAAAIDVVAEEAQRRAVELGFLDNRPAGADALLTSLIDAATEAPPDR